MTKIAIFAAGCFWGIEEKFSSISGVINTEVGYIGGGVKNPTYEMVCTGNTNHAEAVRLFYDEESISYNELLNIFFDIHNPTTMNRQGPDFGSQYRSAIFYQDNFQKLSAQNKIKELNKTKFNNKIVTALEQGGNFWIAEEYHQKYIKKRRFKLFGE
ncbi:MAG: peptide-methionine (S)-S-oxide reductase [Gammaproteobacteria bacterium]|nr:peptide-methionine (S)-S-oxide reductase [Gammaproteobacteria bacterium]